MFTGQQLLQQAASGQQNLPTFQPDFSASLSTVSQLLPNVASLNAALYRGGI